MSVLAKVPGSVWYYQGNLVQVIEENGCLLRVQTPKSRPFLVSPEQLTLPTPEQFSEFCREEAVEAERVAIKLSAISDPMTPKIGSGRRYLPEFL